MSTELQFQDDDLNTASEPEPVVRTYPVIVGKNQRRMYVVPHSVRDQLIGFIAGAYRGSPGGRHLFEWRADGDTTLRGGAVHFESAVRAAFPLELAGVTADDLAKAITDVPRAMGQYVHRPNEVAPDTNVNEDTAPVEEVGADAALNDEALTAEPEPETDEASEEESGPIDLRSGAAVDEYFRPREEASA